MKKLFVLIALACFSFGEVFSQACLDDVWMTLKNNQVGKAKKIMDACIVGNEESADAWLMRGNVFLQIYQRDAERLEKDPTYVSRDPNAIWDANESFYKALQLNKDVQAKTGMLSPIDGQILCAGPLYKIGTAAKEAKDAEKAMKYLSVAARNLRLDKSNANMAVEVGYIYYDLAVLASQQKDVKAYKDYLQDAVNIKTPIPEIYLMLYDLYKADKDTVSCGKILKTALKVVPVDFQADVEATELDYYAMTGQIEKLNTTCDEMAAKYATSAPVLNIIAGHLVNNAQYQKAETIINTALALTPDNFDLNQQMGYRYFFDAVTYEDKIDAAMKEKEYAKVNELKAEQKTILENAHTWVEKAYNINKDDKQNNIMLQQIKVKLLKPVPEELKAKVDSYKG